MNIRNNKINHLNQYNKIMSKNLMIWLKKMRIALNYLIYYELIEINLIMIFFIFILFYLDKFKQINLIFKKTIFLYLKFNFIEAGN